MGEQRKQRRGAVVTLTTSRKEDIRANELHRKITMYSFRRAESTRSVEGHSNDPNCTHNYAVQIIILFLVTS
jgi:hypothetical protein